MYNINDLRILYVNLSYAVIDREYEKAIYFILLKILHEKVKLYY
jgi:hypothetical protein